MGAPTVQTGATSQDISDILDYNGPQAVRFSRYTGSQGGFDVGDAFGRSVGTTEPGLWIPNDGGGDPSWVKFRTQNPVNCIFASGPVAGSTFRIELTRTTSRGPRVSEIDAVIIPPPAGAMVLLR